MQSCCGFRQKAKKGEHEPLLPQYADETTLQSTLHPKMHTLQMFRALSLGYMPSTEQAIINLRTLLALDVMDPNNPDLSDSGILLIKTCRTWLTQFIDLLREKNDDDELQNVIWRVSKSRVQLNTKELSSSVSHIKRQADLSAGSLSQSTRHSPNR